jgi:hypothetical protein
MLPQIRRDDPFIAASMILRCVALVRPLTGLTGLNIVGHRKQHTSI